MTDPQATGDSAFAAILRRFETLGCRFVTAPERMRAAFLATRVLVFDWDGVLGSGSKGAPAASLFNEADSMGVNLLRFAIHRRTGQMPICAIVSGETTDAAKAFAQRERFHYVYSGVRSKPLALEHLLNAHSGLRPEGVTFFFDDVNDLPLARICGLRIMINRRSSPMLRDLVIERGLADYVTGCTVADGAIRECCELLLALCGDFAAVIDSRIHLDAQYETYFAERQRIETQAVKLTGS